MTREEYEEFYNSWCNSQMSGDAFALIANNYVFNLELKIKTQETIIRDKTAIMEAMAQPKTCDGCVHFRTCNEVDVMCVRYYELSDKYEPKAKP